MYQVCVDKDWVPNQVFLGSQSPDRLWEVERPWFDKLVEPENADRAFGRLIEEKCFIALVACADPFKHVLLRERFWEDVNPILSATLLTAPLLSRTPPLLTDAQLSTECQASGCLPLYDGVGTSPVGVVKPGHSEDESLSGHVLLASTRVDPSYCPKIQFQNFQAKNNRLLFG